MSLSKLSVGEWRDDPLQSDSRKDKFFGLNTEEISRNHPQESFKRHESMELRHLNDLLQEKPEKVMLTEEDNEDKSSPKRDLLKIFGLSTGKKPKERKLDLEKFEEERMTVDMEDELLRKLTRKTEKIRLIKEENEIMPGERQVEGEWDEIEKIGKLDDDNAIGEFISGLEKESYDRIEAIKKKNKEYLDQINQEKQNEFQKKANILIGEENSQENMPQNREIISENEKQYDLPIRKLMLKLKNKLNKKEKSPERQVSPEKIRFEKSFRHFLKQKREKLLKESCPIVENKEEKTYFDLKPRPFIPNKMTKDELELISFFFEDIPKQQENYVLKSDVSKYLLVNPRIMELYNLIPSSLNISLSHFASELPGLLNFKEFCHFLKNPRDVLPTSSLSYTKDSLLPLKLAQIRELSNTNLLSEQDMIQIEKIFTKLDKSGDLIVSRRELISVIRKQMFEKLGLPAIYIAKIDKVLTLERLLYQIEREEYNGDENIMAAKKNISWLHFIKYFKEYKKIDFPSRDVFWNSKPLIKHEIFDDQDFIDISADILGVFKTQFDGLEMSNEGLVNTDELIVKIKGLNQWKFFKVESARRNAEKFGIKNESVGEVIDRIQKEADDFIDWDEFLEFFTKRGRPKYFIIDKEERKRVFQKKLNEVLTLLFQQRKFETLKSVFYVENQKSIETSSPKALKLQGYDSDPENRYQSQAIDLSIFESRKTKKIQQTLQKNKLKITVPHPFQVALKSNQTKSISQIRLEQSLDEKQKINETPYESFKAKKIPKKVRQRGLFQEIMQKQEERREIVKKHSKAITKQNEKPFSFYLRDNKIKKKHQEKEKFVFKANPIPWFSSLKNKMKLECEKEEIRKENIQRNAMISLSLSKLPPRMEMHKKNNLYSNKENNENFLKFSFQPEPRKEMPDFERHHKIFQELLDNKRSQFQPTIPIQPNFSEAKKLNRRDYMDEQNMIENKIRQDPIQAFKKFQSQKPSFQASSTKKWEAMVEKRKKDMEIKELKEREKEQKFIETEEKRANMKFRVQKSPILLESMKDSVLRKTNIEQFHQNKLKEDEKNYLLWKREMEDRLNQKPLLLESSNVRNFNSKTAEMQELEQINELLGEQGLENLEAFNEEEREIIKEMARMKEQGLLIDE